MELLMPKTALLLTLSFLAMGCAQSPRQPLQIAQSLPAIAAEFQTTVEDEQGDDKPRQYRWRFWRTQNRVETLNLEDKSGEVWEKTEQGEFTYQRLFHAHQQIIDYVPGDLKAIGIAPDWTGLSSLLNHEIRAALHGGEPETVEDRQAVHYQGGTEQAPLEVSWLIREQLPAAMIRHENGHRLTTRIVAVYPGGQAPWSTPITDDYRHLDFSDIGDKENDPFIKSILPKLKGSHAHEH